MYKQTYFKFRSPTYKKSQNKKIDGVTIVTLSLGLSEKLKLTLKSVNLQEHTIRHIIVDGSNNREISEFCAQNFPSVEVFKQNPQGIYSAMNYGLDKVLNNSYVMFLNEADFLLGPNAITELMHALKNQECWGYGCTIAFSMNDDGLDYHGCNSPNWRNFRMGLELIPHPSMIAPAIWLKEINGFKTRYRIAGDTELSFRLFKQYGPARFVNYAISAHEKDGVSTELETRSNFEGRKARFLNFPITTFIKMLLTLFPTKIPKSKKGVIEDGVPEINNTHFDICDGTQLFPFCCRKVLVR